MSILSFDSFITSFTPSFSVIELCESFVEGEFCTAEAYEGVFYKIKMQTDGDRLYIESYVYEVNISIDYHYVNSEILYFDLVEGKVYFSD